MKSGGQIPWNAIAICEMSKISWQTGNLKMNEDLGNHLKDHLSTWCIGWISPKVRERERQSKNSSIWKESITKNLSRICFDRGGIWEEIFWLLILKNWESWMNQKFIPEDWMQKKSWQHQKTENLCFLYQKLSNIITKKTNSKNPLWDGNPRKSHGDKEEFQPEKFKDDAEARKDFWSIQGDIIDRHHIKARVQLHVPKEESFPGKKRAIWRHHPKRWTSWAKSLRVQFWGTNIWGNLTARRLCQQSSVEFGEKM